MRKPLKITLSIVGAIVALPVVLLGTTTVVNAVATKSDLAAITPYGTLVPVAGNEMNVVDTGAPAQASASAGSGAETIVLLPGLGTAAPGLDFEPLIAQLKGSHRVIAVEPFGTGLSDQTSVPRTAENIAREVHEALQYLGVDRYVLMGHSIAGIYALEYSQAYGDELVAFVGIDSSVPGQPGWDEPTSTSGLAELRSLGILRVLNAVAGDPFAELPHDAQTKQQLGLLTTRNSVQTTMLDEMNRTVENFESVRGATFPAGLPVLLFVAEDDGDVAGWLELHEGQAASVDRGEVVALPGEHYLHYTQSAEIASDTDAFLGGLTGS